MFEYWTAADVKSKHINSTSSGYGNIL